MLGRWRGGARGGGGRGIRDLGPDGEGCLRERGRRLITSARHPASSTPAPHRAIEAAWVAGVPVDNDIGLFFRSLGSGAWDEMEDPPKVRRRDRLERQIHPRAALIAHILSVAGRSVQLPATSAAACSTSTRRKDGGVVVLELSSYQTDLARSLTPDVGGLHQPLARSPRPALAGSAAIFAAKRRLFAEGGPDRAIIGGGRAGGAASGQPGLPRGRATCG